MRFWWVLLLAGCGQSQSDTSIDAATVHDIDAAAAVDAAKPADGSPAVSDPCFPSPHAGHSLYSCNGLAFDVEVSQACLAGGCGVILDVHGLTMSAAMEDANMQMRVRGSAAGFVVIQPSANPAPPQASFDQDTDDAKIYDFLTRATAVYHIDPHRIHMTGFSQGGFMTWRFLCAHSDVLASVAPAAAASNCPPALLDAACSFTEEQVPTQAIPVLYMHGTQDSNYVPFSCAQPQVDAAVAAWGLTANGVIASSSTYRRSRWTSSAGGLLELIAHDYSSNEQVPFVAQTELQGHCYPGSSDPGGQPGQLFSFKCEQQASFTWGAEVVAFFVAHPRP
jgi:poly(3-hydroxybutyrate) depolymerase